MCCLTIVKTHSQKVVITHNRDEQWSRQTHGAQVVEHIVNGKKIWMPKDNLSNGTWIGTDGTKVAAILNGFKENHIKKATYRASRGTIIPQYLAAENLKAFTDSFDPSGLEPFTLVLIDDEINFVEYGWDEKDIHLSYHKCTTPTIYSSATLYNDDIQMKRKSLFGSFLEAQVSPNDLWEFHQRKGDNHGDFINVDYNAEISTVAISQIVLGGQSEFYYQSLLGENKKQSIILK